MNRTKPVEGLLLGSALSLFSIGLLGWFVFSNLPFVSIFRDKQYWLITWKTHLAFVICVGVLLWLPFFLFYWFKKDLLSKNILLVATSMVAVLFLLETVLCIIPLGRTYWENQGNAYCSISVPCKYIYYQRDSGIVYQQKNAEFEYRYQTNKLGFVGVEWALKKAVNKIRIISLGDSFTEGVGAPVDSAYPILLQNILGENYEVLQAGIAGSDPVFGYKNMEKRLLPYQPDIVLQTISENDVFLDIGVRGGLERYSGDTLLKFKDPPAIEPLYALSYTSRPFIEVLGASPINRWLSDDYVQDKEVIEEKHKILFDLLSHYEKLAAENHFEARIVFLPMVHEMKSGKYRFDFTPEKKYIATLQHVKYIDLMPCYQEKMQEKQVLIDKYYWKQDKHHNSRGYQLMANCIAGELK